jgi:tetratricopeptide (TPR) repeat protein
LVAVFLVVRTLAVGATPLTDLGLLPLFNAAATIVATSVKVFFLPDAAIALYHYQPGMFDTLNVRIVLSYAVVAALLFFATWLWRRNKAMLFWLLWSLVWIVVMFNVGKFAEFYFMDKILYLASLGGCVLLAWGLLAMPLHTMWRSTLLGAAVCAFAGMSLWRAAYFDNEQAYFEQAVKFAPDFPLLRYAIANLYRDQGDLQRARAEYQATVRLQPEHSYAHNNLGNLYFMANEFDRAVAAWQQALRVDASNPQPYYNIGVALERQGRTAQALDYYRQYLSRQPRPPAAVLNHIRQLQGH